MTVECLDMVKELVRNTDVLKIAKEIREGEETGPTAKIAGFLGAIGKKLRSLHVEAHADRMRLAMKEHQRLVEAATKQGTAAPGDPQQNVGAGAPPEEGTNLTAETSCRNCAQNVTSISAGQEPIIVHVTQKIDGRRQPVELKDLAKHTECHIEEECSECELFMDLIGDAYEAHTSDMCPMKTEVLTRIAAAVIKGQAGPADHGSVASLMMQQVITREKEQDRKRRSRSPERRAGSPRGRENNRTRQDRASRSPGSRSPGSRERRDRRSRSRSRSPARQEKTQESPGAKKKAKEGKRKR